LEPKFIPDGNGNKLNVGSGLDIRPGFINLDYIPNDGIFQWNLEIDRGDNGNIFPFDNNQFEYILAKDVMEHIPHRVPDKVGEFFFHLINDMIRISKDHAIWEIISPHRPESMGACGHTRLIDESTFHPWMGVDKGSLEVTKLPVGRIQTILHENARQWDPKDYTRFGRSIVKRLIFKVKK